MVKMRLKKCSCLLLTIGLCLFGNMAVYAESEVDTNPAVYVNGTTVNGVNVSGLTPAEAKTHIEEFLVERYELLVIDSSQRETIISHQDINLNAVVKAGLEEVLTKENEGGRKSGPSSDNSYSVQLEVTYDEERLAEKLDSLKCMTSGVIQTRDACISPYEEGKEFTIIPEVKGNSVNKEALYKAVKDAIISGQRTVDLYASDCYEKVKVTADNEELKKLCNTMNQCRSMTIDYVFGEEKEQLEGSVIASWIQETSGTQIVFDREKAAAYVNSLAETYDTAGKERIFKTHSGGEAAVTGPYGWKIDVESETDSLLQMIQAGQSGEREPVYSQTAAARGAEWGLAYVEIDMTNQHVYLYQNGECVLDTPCVTGNVSKGWTTPPGIFSLYYKQKDRVLRGEDYESPVSYWMPFNGGIGLHDANWRGKFGGDIYKTSGSHGCINLPPAKAAQIYEAVYKGMPIICYY